MHTRWLACLVLLVGCPSVTVDQNEQGNNGPTVEFDPANSIVPFPNNLLIDPATGKVNLPEQCNESASSAATRTQVLNKLDGFGTYETAMTVTFTEPVDIASFAGNALLIQRVRAGEPNDPTTAIPVPVVAIPGKTIRFNDQTNIAACTDPVMVDQVTLIPTAPLEQHATYTVALLGDDPATEKVEGITTANGTAFEGSFTWQLIRSPDPVVVFDSDGNLIVNRTPLDPEVPADAAQLQGIALLWNAHHAAITFLAAAGHPADQLLLAWEFNTQTTTDPLDPAVDGSPASTPTALPLLGNVNPAAAAAVVNHLGPFAPCAGDAPDDTQCFLRVLLGGGKSTDLAANYAVGKATCAAAGCANIGTVLNSLLLSKQYLTDVTNTEYTGTGSAPIPGAWSDPVSPQVVHDTAEANPIDNDPQAQIGVLVLLPTDPPPATGYPVVIFQHGITRSQGDVFGIAGDLTFQDATKQGFAVVAIDAALHGSRAVRISDAANAIPPLDCSDVTDQALGPRPDLGPDPTTHPGCYAPIFSTDLAATRDSFRQSLLDIQQLVTSLEACGTTNCGALKVDVDNIFYVGHSLGGMLGSMDVGFTDINASVLDASAAGWLDILENTDQTAAFQCPLVDALIDAGVLSGDKFDPLAGTGLCTTDAWKTDPGYLQFAAIARWILDPADPANFNVQLAHSRFFLQEIVDDEVFPNIATDNQGALVQQLRGDASCGVRYSRSPIDGAARRARRKSLPRLPHRPPANPACPAGNTFDHGSLLLPGRHGELQPPDPAAAMVSSRRRSCRPTPSSTCSPTSINEARP